MEAERDRNERHIPMSESGRNEPPGADVAGSPGVSDGGPVDEEATRQEERESVEKAEGPAHGLRGDLGDSPPGED